MFNQESWGAAKDCKGSCGTIAAQQDATRPEKSSLPIHGRREENDVERFRSSEASFNDQVE